MKLNPTIIAAAGLLTLVLAGAPSMAQDATGGTTTEATVPADDDDDGDEGKLGLLGLLGLAGLLGLKRRNHDDDHRVNTGNTTRP